MPYFPDDAVDPSTEVGVPPCMNGAFSPLSNRYPVQLLERDTRAAQILDSVATAFLVLQSKTDLARQRFVYC